jgi:hypothetical protein
MVLHQQDPHNPRLFGQLLQKHYCVALLQQPSQYNGCMTVPMNATAGRLALLTSLALGAAACGGGVANPAPSASGVAGTVTSGPGGSGQHSSGSFSLAFAMCMRAHGVPDFPDPDGQAGQLGPGSGIDPGSPRFQSALNGPCKPLAPPGWLSTGSGPITR